MKRLSAMLVVIIAAFTGTGCVSLKEVREFAGESARLASYREVTVRFRDTYAREAPYLYGNAAEAAKRNDAARKAIYDNLLRLQDGVVLYMATLAKLAGDDAFDVSKNIDGLAKGIKAFPEAGLNTTHVDAFFSLAKVLSRWVTSAYQHRAVREMVIEGDAPLQIVLEGLGNVVRYYGKTMANERKSVLGLFDVELRFTDDAKERLLQALSRAHVQAKSAEYATYELQIAELEKGIKIVADGHGTLRRNVEQLSSREARVALSAIVKNLKTIRANIQALQP